MARVGNSGHYHLSMLKPAIPPDPDANQLAQQVAALRAGLQGADPGRLAERTGASYRSTGPGEGEYTLSLWGETVRLPFPGLVAHYATGGQALPLPGQALVMYYFKTADGTPPAGRWIAFSELPGGRFYQAAYQGYSGVELRRAFGPDLAAFARACERLGGHPQAHGDAAFAFQALPRLALLAAAWQGDEDFPPSYAILFDASAHHYLPVDVCAILGGTLARRILKAKES